MTGGFASWQEQTGEVTWPTNKEPGSANKTATNNNKAYCKDRSVSGVSASTSQASQLFESFKLLAAGGCAGAISKTCTAPLARLTILYQVQALNTSAGALTQLGLSSALQHIIRQEGVFSLWKGNSVTILHRIPFSAINFWAYERAIEAWNKNIPSETSTPALDFSRRLLAGGFAGSLACAAAYPLDLVRTRLSAQLSCQYYSGISNTLRTIVRDEGARGLYRGLGATLAQVAPSLAINYAAYESMRAASLYRHPGQDTPTMAQSLMCGSAAGLISSTLTFPLDLVRRRMQLEGQRGAQLAHNGYLDMFRNIYKSQGLRGFYHGILPEYYKVVPGVAIAFCVYELLKSTAGVQTNKEKR